MTRAFVSAAIVATALTASARISAPQRPATGTASLSGIVVTADATPVPVRRAEVTLRDESGFGHSELSDDQGRFVFTGLPAGRFSLTASRPAFITATYGARRPGRPGTPLSLAAGESMTSVTLYMSKGAAISGVVRDPQGRPAARVQMLVRPVGSIVEASIGRGSTPVLTDDRGAYRAYGLSPGAYVVAAVPQLLSYATTEMRAMTPAEIDAALRTLTARQPLPAPAPSAPEPPRRMYVPIFYPNVPSQSDAAPVTVNTGDDIGGIDITLSLVSAITIEGRIVRPDGRPATGVRLLISGANNRQPVHFSAAPILSTRPGADGRFKYSSVAPGAYTVTASSQDGLYAVSHLTAGNDDVTGVTLALQPGLTFMGFVRFDATSLKRPFGSPSYIQLQPTGPFAGGSAVVNGTALGASLSVNGPIDADGAFELAGVIPGPYKVVVSTPTGWWLRSVLADGRDVLDESWTMTAHVSNARIVFSDQHSEVSGMLQTPAGVAAPEYSILIFSADRKHWVAGARRTRTAKPGSDGRYTLTDLPAGDYLVAALEDVDQTQLDDPAFLERVAASAVKTTVRDGGKVQLDLRIAR